MVRARHSPRPEELEGRGDSGDKDARKIRAEGKLVGDRLAVTPSLRRKLKKPVGKLYLPKQVASRGFREVLRRSPLVVTVGDRVTETAQRLGRTPEVQVVDGYERRERRTPPDLPYVRLLKASNPPGFITKAAESAVRSALGGPKPARVLIDGEEDLLAIIAIDAAPLGSSVYYGQPGVGVVLVTVDERAKRSVRRILASMRGGQDGLD